MSSTRVLILGALLAGPHHGYEVRKKLELWGVEHWANVAFGSIYHALTKLSQEGLLEVVEGGKGGKTVYAITDAGRAEFKRQLDSYWREIMPIVDPFLVAITFMDHLPKHELLAAIRERRKLLLAGFAMAERTLASPHQKGASRHLDECLRLTSAQFRAQLEWLEDVAGRVERDEVP
jgi:DNA-binding PadR family transcriptional regulator